jgi:putative acetyltransferase
MVVVLGDPAYYRRFGFVSAKSLGLQCEFDVPDDVFMVLALHAGALDRTHGIVRYEPEFNAV